MPKPSLSLDPSKPLVVGSFGDAASLAAATPGEVRAACDVVEIRLDLLDANALEGRIWQHLTELPLLFTARRSSEGGQGDLSATRRRELLESVLDDAALLDIEVASIGEMTGLIAELGRGGLPWIGSFHDFHRVPATGELRAARDRAQQAGAAAFKAAVQLDWGTDHLAPLGQFLHESRDFPVSLMGMGPLAPVSRVFFAQLGSVLNYGYLGETPTAPGQWSARQLKDAIASVEKEG